MVTALIALVASSGWLGQIDLDRDPVFYDRTLTFLSGKKHTDVTDFWEVAARANDSDKCLTCAAGLAKA